MVMRVIRDCCGFADLAGILEGVIDNGRWELEGVKD